MENIAKELHKPIRKIKQYRKVISERINECWACDLVFMDKFGDENNGYKYILTVIDLYLHIILSWTGYVGINLKKYAIASEYNDHINNLPEVKRAKNRMAFFPKTII